MGHVSALQLVDVMDSIKNSTRTHGSRYGRLMIGRKQAQFVLHHAAEGRFHFSSANCENLYGAKRARLNATIPKYKGPRGFEERSNQPRI